MITPPISQVLTRIGQDLIFSDFEIKGLPGFNIDKLNEVTEKQIFSVQIASQDVVDNNIVEGLEFTSELGAYNYTFKIISPPIDMLGWSKLKLSFISREVL